MANGDPGDVLGVELTGLEAPRLVHVDPDAVIESLVIEVVKASEPHLGRIVVEPVDEDGDFGPDLIDQIVAIGLILVHG